MRLTNLLSVTSQTIKWTMGFCLFFNIMNHDFLELPQLFNFWLNTIKIRLTLKLKHFFCI